MVSLSIHVPLMVSLSIHERVLRQAQDERKEVSRTAFQGSGEGASACAAGHLRLSLLPTIVRQSLTNHNGRFAK